MRIPRIELGPQPWQGYVVTIQLHSHIKLWRTERDSNPRYDCSYAGFQDQCIQPLYHLSFGWSKQIRTAIKRTKISCPTIRRCSNVFILVGEVGVEPTQLKATDLQSAPALRLRRSPLFMVGKARIELATPAVSAPYSNQLSYFPTILVADVGVEPHYL